MRLLILGIMFAVWSLVLTAPLDKQVQQKAIVFPKKMKENTTEKVDHVKNSNQKNVTTSSNIKSDENASESSKDPSPTTYIPLTVNEKFAKSGSSVSPALEEVTTQMPPMPKLDVPNVGSILVEAPSDSLERSDISPEIPKDGPILVEAPSGNMETKDMPSDVPEDGQTPILDEASSENSESRDIPLPEMPLPADTTDGLIEYNLGNPLALRLHLPWWPLKDMLRSIQDAISLMNITMSRHVPESDSTKTKIVNFDNRNYTLKVKIFRPAENNRLLVRLISLTPVIEEGKIPADKTSKIDEERESEALVKGEMNPISEVAKKDDAEAEEDKKEEDDDDKKEKKSKTKNSKKEKEDKKKKKEKDGDDSDEDSD